MRFTCSSCSKALRVNNALAGKRIKCPACSQVQLVPEAVEEVAEGLPPRKAVAKPQAVIAAPPAKKRDLVQDDERPRKKRQVDDDDTQNEDEDFAPRKKKKKKRKKAAASPLLSWPILAAGGGLIGVAAIVLVVVLVLNRRSDTGERILGGAAVKDDRTVQVKFLVPAKIGEERDIEAHLKLAVKVDGPGLPINPADVPEETISKARIKTLAISNKGVETNVQVTVQEVKVVRNGEHVEVVKPGTVLLVRDDKFGGKVTSKSGKLDPKTQFELENIFSRNSTQTEALLAAFATDKEQRPGDTWTVDKEAFAFFLRSLPTAHLNPPKMEDMFRAWGKFVGRSAEEGKTFLDFEMNMSMEGRNQNEEASLKITITMRLPEDYSTGHTRLAVQMSIKGRRTIGAQSSSFDLNLDYTEGARYLQRSGAAPKSKAKTEKEPR